MQLAAHHTRAPQLLQALEALAQRPGHQEAASALRDELSGITVLVARKFTNEKTADGLLEAFHLTIGCISVGLSQASLPDTPESKLTFLLQQGAERVFQMGFRHIKTLCALPYTAFVSDFDQDPFVQQRNLKSIFYEICRAVPGVHWMGDASFQRELLARQHNQAVVDCARWLRQHHFNGPIRDSDLDAHAVIAIAIFFALLNDGRIVARAGQKEIESLIKQVRTAACPPEPGWARLLKQLPAEHQPIVQKQMDDYQPTIIKKIFSRTSLRTLLTEIQDCYASSEVDIDYP